MSILLFLFSSDKFPEMKLLGHMAVLLLIFRGNSMLCYIVAAPIYNFNTHKVSLFSTSLTMLVIFCFLDDSHLDRSEVVYHCDFDVEFPDD